MQVRRIGYVGMRTDYVDAMTSFFRDVIGLEAAGEGETITFQRLPTHRRDLLEVYAQEHRDARLIPDDADVVIAFVVDDIREAMAEVQGPPASRSSACPYGRRRRSATRHLVSSCGSSYAPRTVACSRSSRYPTRPRTKLCLHTRTWDAPRGPAGREAEARAERSGAIADSRPRDRPRAQERQLATSKGTLEAPLHHRRHRHPSAPPSAPLFLAQPSRI